jgi:REP element-mobilizing transposase RayT
MITWTTYGTWLQGDERGYVKNGQTYQGNKSLKQRNKNLQSQQMVKLSRNQQQVVRKAIAKEAKLQNQRIYALSIQSNHVHIVVEYTRQPISKIVAYYKKYARLALKAAGLQGKLWTKGYDKRFCFDRTSLEQRIQYVQNHNI